MSGPVLGSCAFARWTVALLLTGLTAAGQAQLTKEETAGIERALGYWNLSISDLGYEKRLYSDPYRLPIVDQALMAPFDGLSEVMKLQGVARSAGAKLGPIVEAAWRKLQKPTKQDTDIPPLAIPSTVPAACRSQVAAAAHIVVDATNRVHLALAKLTDQERADLLRNLPEIVEAPVQPLPRARQGKHMAREKVFELLAKVDFGLIEAASSKLTVDLQPIVEQMKQVAPKIVIAKPIAFTTGGLHVVLGSTSDDKYVGKENELVIDFKGNDSYSGRVGSGIGGCGVLIDLAGNDRFDLSDFSGGFGMLGCGAVFDIGGNDFIHAKNCSLGSALAGAGVFYKEGGNDVYKSAACTQGFAVFGVGILEDTKGSDRYDATDFAQGAALTKGFGWLIDREGNDVYTVGGRVSGEPLDPKSWQCFGQGAASGFREDDGGQSGGIGILTDLKGDDVYKGGMYCQGASYWFSLGALMDDEGNDSYVADYYAQAAAMHFAAAYLVDLKGDDLYTVRHGAMQAIGHDYSVAMLLDREGDDVYSGRDSWPGHGTDGGIGIFIDSAGNDRYFGPPGIAVASHGVPSIGLFVDLAGKDEYARGLADGQVSLTGTWGIAVDFPDAPSAPGRTAASHVRPKPGTATMPAPAEMERIFTKASQWGVGSLEQEVEDNVDKLVAIGLPALEWMLRTKLATADRHSMRVFDAVISATGDPGKALVPSYATSKEGDAAHNALALAATHSIAGVEPYLKDAIVDAKLRRVAIRAAGAIKAQSLVPALVGYAEGSDPALALVALQALSAIGTEDAVYTYVKMVTSPELPIRKTALKALAKWPVRALAAAKVLLTREGRPQRVGIELLGEIGTDESMALLVDQLKAKDPGCRMEAVRVLAAKDAAKYGTLIEPLKKDPDADVRELADWALKKS